ncbi:hypothetical protein QBC43DRAFT_340055 [Cladorrhinum sp. PSN259]|nr:hypothetical protein QBC43DRAFT_340055 [Cladorrhinum sp. PSN259]
MDGKAPLATAHSVRSAPEDESHLEEGSFHLQGEQAEQGDVDDIHPNLAKEDARDHPFPIPFAFSSSSFSLPSSACTSSLQLPFFNCVSSSDHSVDHSLLLHAPGNANDIENDDLNDNCFYNSNCNTSTATTTSRDAVFYTFFLSPSASTASIVSSVWSSGPASSDADSNETHTTMPAPTYDGPADHVPQADALDYFYGPAYSSAEQTPSRPQTASKHGRSFSRWGRRNHQQSPSNGQAWRVYGRASLDLPAMKGSQKRPGGHSRSSSIHKRQAQAAAVPQMSREEFEALPLAIQRKYFSTLERLRFAQESGLVDGISQHYDDISNFRRRKPRKDRSLSEQIVTRINRPGSGLESQFSSSSSSPSYVAPSETTHEEEELTREKQVDLARRLRASVILDAADEALCKLNLDTSRRDLTTDDTLFSPPSPRRNSMNSHYSFRNHVEQQTGDAPIPQSFYDSFRWLEEDEDLDLRLFLDDYHANLREGVPSNSKQRPSFRRRLSISKLPFGRSSFSSSRPGTNHAATSPTTPVHTRNNSGSSPAVQHLTRRKSRALSLITPKHGPQPSITAFDPAAAHYQDPEARLKLRVYLASPQKFDEAVEFGFPSADVLSPTLPQGLVDETANMSSFLVDGDDDENASLNSNVSSLADPDSPKTPEAFENKPSGLRPPRFGATILADPNYGRDFGSNLPEGSGYTQAPVSSREMTLRMTLTRPDLRAHEDEIYGWQQKQQGHQQHTRKPTIPMVSSQAVEARATDIREGGAHKNSFEKWVGVDHWNSSTPTEKGMMKRIWNRMRRN